MKIAAAPPASLWTPAFTLLCVAQFLGYAQHFMRAPVLPLFLTQLGASPFVVGLVLACFAVTSVLVRPLVGHWADRWSEAGVMIYNDAYSEFAGGRDGQFVALDARTGNKLWETYLGPSVAAGPMTYSANGKQYVSIQCGSALFTFGLR